MDDRQQDKAQKLQQMISTRFEVNSPSVTLENLHFFPRGTHNLGRVVCRVMIPRRRIRLNFKLMGLPLRQPGTCVQFLTSICPILDGSFRYLPFSRRSRKDNTLRKQRSLPSETDTSKLKNFRYHENQLKLKASSLTQSARRKFDACMYT